MRPSLCASILFTGYKYQRVLMAIVNVVCARQILKRKRQCDKQTGFTVRKNKERCGKCSCLIQNITIESHSGRNAFFFLKVDKHSCFCAKNNSDVRDFASLELCVQSARQLLPLYLTYFYSQNRDIPEVEPEQGPRKNRKELYSSTVASKVENSFVLSEFSTEIKVLNPG